MTDPDHAADAPASDPSARGMMSLARTMLPPAERGDPTEPAWRTGFVVVSAAVLLVIPEYAPAPADADRFGRLAAWAAWIVACWGVAPILLWKFVLGRSLGDLGLGLGRTRKHLPIYAVMAVLMAPIVVLMSATRAFQDKYPFLRVDPHAIDWARLLQWELLYALQFVALELFFRGYLTLGLRRRLGGDAVWVMVLPYCMIHFGKPLPETLAAIIAGVALGSLALRTRSIWMGAALHIAVAWSMDAASLMRQAG